MPLGDQWNRVPELIPEEAHSALLLRRRVCDVDELAVREPVDDPGLGATADRLRPGFGSGATVCPGCIWISWTGWRAGRDG